MERKTEIFVILGYFLLYNTNNLQNQNQDKMKKTPGNIIGLQKCTINDNHIMHGS